jgi:UPF0176 protein
MTHQLLITSFYRFVDLPDYRALRGPWLVRAHALGLKGSILLAAEGLNTTLCGEPDSLRLFLSELQQDARLADLRWLESWHTGPAPFGRMQIRLKSEIIRMNTPNLSPAQNRGTYLKGEAWDQLLQDPDTVLIDTRNAYEVRLGTFKGALNPNLQHFSELPQWLDQHMANKQQKKIAMFCTGGIRCEKSTAYLRQQGFADVYHLEGGILGYFQDTGNAKGLWDGSCFVFDERFAVDAQLNPVPPVRCVTCNTELLTEDLEASTTAELYCRACTIVPAAACAPAFRPVTGDNTRTDH